jgi:predicted DNA-binding transcriptional regulator AlpA
MTNDPPTSDGRSQRTPGRFVRLPAALAMVGLGRTAWLEMVRRGLAPKPIHIGRAALWVEDEIKDFMAERVRQSRANRP